MAFDTVRDLHLKNAFKLNTKTFGKNNFSEVTNSSAKEALLFKIATLTRSYFRTRMVHLLSSSSNLEQAGKDSDIDGNIFCQ